MPNIGNNLQFNKYQALSLRIENLSAEPGSPVAGQVIYNTTLGKFGVYNGSTWDYMGTATATGDFSSNTATSVDGEIVLFSGTGGKTGKRATGTGIAKLTSGVLSTATAGTDYTTPASTETFTNKSFNANGTGNVLSNVEIADFAAAAVVTAAETITANNVDTAFPTAAAVKAYADGLLGASDALVLKGGLDASTNPNYPAASAGDVYKITVAGKVGGASGPNVEVNDTIICTVDASAAGNHATVGANWIILQNNVDAASTTATGYVELATVAEAEAKTDAVRAVTPAGLATFARRFTATIGDGSTTAIAVTHNLGNQHVQTQIFNATTHEQIWTDVTNTSTTVCTVTFAVAPTTNQYRVVVIG